MISGVVVDIGNSRMKWGLVRDSTIVNTVSLDGDSPLSWAEQSSQWNLDREHWVIASVHPQRMKTLVGWLDDSRVSVIRDSRDVPIQTEVDEPLKLGVDRLLNALAATRRFPGRGIIISSIGTAVTIDRISRDGVFQGGMILPGVRLMAEALGQNTAQLPIVSDFKQRQFPGRNTASAISVGIHSAIAGARLLAQTWHVDQVNILTGGDAELFIGESVEWIPTLTLEGIRIAAETLA